MKLLFIGSLRIQPSLFASCRSGRFAEETSAIRPIKFPPCMVPENSAVKLFLADPWGLHLIVVTSCLLFVILKQQIKLLRRPVSAR